MESLKKYSSKSNSKGKGEKFREGNKVSSRQKVFESSSSDMEMSTVTFPVIRQAELEKLVPTYDSVLTRNATDGVGMDDLDQLQQDLERMLSTVAVRQRLMKFELESADRSDDRRDRRRNAYFEKQSFKKKRSEDLPKYTTKNMSRILKTRYASMANNIVDITTTKKKETVLEHDLSDRFWMSVEPYCAEISKDNVAFLDDLIRECSQPVKMEIPEIGEHYASEWTETTLQTDNGSANKIKKEADAKINNISNSTMETYPSPLVQRLLDTLLDEKLIKQIPNMLEKIKNSDNAIKSSNGIKTELCLEQRLKKQLIAQGILEPEDLHKSFPPEDEILMEIKRCQEELAAVSKHNVSELNRLREAVAKDLKKQEIKSQLDKVDKQILAVHNKILLAKQTHAAEMAQRGFSKSNFHPLDLAPYEQEATAVIRQQVQLHQQLTDLTDMTLIE